MMYMSSLLISSRLLVADVMSFGRDSETVDSVCV